ncbi:IclR family transcriptional regulator [Nesterenkonia ebinurensis]|uniref:IclR family transcriptional regulator n=1 Tax=Nesterenkonia ebinurensis TaxID=2608252 RepID=UPI00123E2746|nr:IclR family transcriptional regulator [Nesterenkonia ebinurensis]
MANSPSGESVLTRLDRVLSVFSGADVQLSVAEVSRRTGLPPATTHRLCHDLAATGWLEQLSGGFAVGTRLWEIANRSAPTMKLAVLARPYLADAHAVIGQHIQLGKIDGDEVLFIDRLSARGAPTIHGSIAGRLPLHLSSTGTVLLAHAPEAFRRGYRSRSSAGLNSEHGTVPDEQRLEQVRRMGYCLQTGALEPDITGVAVPIHRSDGKVIAGLGIVREDQGEVRGNASSVQLLQLAARSIGRAVMKAARDNHLIE